MDNGQTTASRFSFNVSGHILDGKDVREIVIQDFQTLMAQLNDLKDNSTNEFGLLKNEIEAFQTIAQESEDERKTNELSRIAAEIIREENYESKVSAAIVEADVVEKVDNKVAELAPTIQQVTAQLAQKANQNDVRQKAIPISLNDVGSDVITAIEGGGGSTFNLTSIPKQFSVTPDKTTFLEVGENLYDNTQPHDQNKLVIAKTGVINDTTNRKLSTFIPIDATKGKIYLSGRYFTHYAHAFYDDLYNHIPTDQVDNGDSHTKNIPENAAYIRVTLNINDVMDKAMLVYGMYPNNELLNYVPYTVKFKYDISNSDTPEAGNTVTKWEDTDFIQPLNEQLFDKKQSMINASIQSKNGTITPHATFLLSDYIPIDPSRNEVFLSERWFLHYSHAFYDENMVHISTEQSDNGVNNTKQIPQTAKYIRVTVRDVGRLDDLVMLYGSYANNELIPPQKYGLKLSQLPVHSQKHKGKKAVIMGDSLVDGSKYAHYIGQNTGLDVINCGFGGTRAAKYETTINGKFSFHLLVDAILSGDYSEQEAVAEEAGLRRLPDLKAIDWNTIDYVFLAYGTNDFTSNSGIGDGNNMNIVNYDGAINYGVDKLMTAYPHLKFILISPLFRNRWSSDEPEANSDIRPNGAGVYLREYVEILEKVSNTLHVPFINSYDNSGINKYNQHIYFVDGLHLDNSNNGYNHANEYFGNFIANQFKMYY